MKKIDAVVPQGSIDEPLLLNSFINNAVILLGDTLLITTLIITV